MLSPTFPEVHLPHLADTPIPPMLRVRLTHPKGGPIADIAGAVDEALGKSSRLADLRSDARVAVAVGSRGIAHIPEVVAAAVRHLKQRGFAPFIVPAMGSHGGATAEGQRELIAHYGITEATTPEGEEFGLERFQRLLVQNRDRPLSEIRSRLDAALGEFVQDEPQGDDETLVLLRRRAE